MQQIITFSYQGEEQTGILVKETTGECIIKLSSGYNIVCDKKDLVIKEQKDIEQKPLKKKKQQEEKKDLPTIALLHTGGTIASKVDYSTGAVIAQFSEEDIKAMFPELSDKAIIDSKLVGNMQSEMMRFAHWNILIREVEQALTKGVKGVIITHGTDALHYSAAALSFALQGINIPVIFVGSQRSSDRPSSDAASNLLCATEFILQSGFSGVGVCMHEGIHNDACVILPGVNTRKMHTSRRDAFKSINTKPFARISYPELDVEQLREYPQQEKTKITFFDETLKIGLLYAHPHMYAQEFLAYKDFDGLVFGLFGIGHMPTAVTDEHNKEHESIKQAINQLTTKMPVVGAAQTIYGRVDMNVYTPGRTLIQAGILGQGLTTTIETAFVKLAWLLSNHKKDLKELYHKDFVGENSTRLEEQHYE